MKKTQLVPVFGSVNLFNLFITHKKKHENLSLSLSILSLSLYFSLVFTIKHANSLNTMYIHLLLSNGLVYLFKQMTNIGISQVVVLC